MTTKPTRIEQWVQAGLLVLVALMPFHAFLSVWLGSITHHQAIIQAWKEALLLVLALLGAMLAIRDTVARDRLRTWPVYMAGLIAAVALIVSVATRPPFTAVAFGAKTDLGFLLAFVLAILVSTPPFVRKLTWAVVIPGAVVIAFGLVEVFVLPPDFLTHFGYGPHTVLPFETLDQTVSNLRFPSTLGGPNQLGTYLMLPTSLAALLALRRKNWWWLLMVGGGVLMLINTYSRAAWLGAICAAVVLVLGLVPAKLRLWAAGVTALVSVAAAAAIAFLVKNGSRLAHYILHSTTHSDEQHLESLHLGLTDSLARPLGHGLGTAGPAVFHTGQGLIIENNYLQIAYETGLAGALAFVLMLAVTARELAYRAVHNDLAAAALAALVGVSVTSLFLPAWTDSSTALIVWTAAGAAIGLHRSTSRV